MKTCSKCKETKEFSEFHKKRNSYQYMCKECRKIYIHEHYMNNKEKYIEKARVSKRKTINWFREYKCTLKCEYCSENHPACLDFHHIDSFDKLFTIGECIAKVSKKRLLDEISKCRVLCANCHRKLHYNEFYLPTNQDSNLKPTL